MCDVRELRINLIWLVAGKWIGSDMRTRFNNINIAVESMAHLYYLLFFRVNSNVVVVVAVFFFFFSFVCNLALVVSRSTTLMNCRYNVGFFSHFCYYLIRYFRWICNEFCADILGWCIFGLSIILWLLSYALCPTLYGVDQLKEDIVAKKKTKIVWAEAQRLVIVIVNTHMFTNGWLSFCKRKLCSIINIE